MAPFRSNEMPTNSMTSRSGGRPEMDYIPQDCQEQVEDYLGNYRKIKEILEELCAISRELLRRRERF